MLNHVTHRKIMFQIVNEIYSDQRLKNIFAFKWWTLCYFLYSLPRFSTDLDFDYIAKEWKNHEINDVELMTRLKNILQKFWTIKDEKNKKFTYFFLLNYQEEQHNIKIEISKKKYKQTKYEQINFFGKDILAMSKTSIFAHKIVALSERWKNRDLFDVHFFFKQNFPLDEQIIYERTNRTLEDFFFNLQRTIPQKFTQKTILAEIGDLITEKQKYFMKNEMIEEVNSYLQFALFESEKNNIKQN